ncbi:MAG: hypothetical protein CMD25_01725 [Flavobacteriales bacterium]|jgi:hypothetical protein|nr:hypothetical protein [Flavobacteriales bacterium]|tara:strand:- start:1805 stop:2551 length:747 start_codon:yes stop_codon:yes gene_type:complete
MAKNTPPKTIKRNEHGLLEGIKYSYQDDGLIDWRKMVKNEHIVPNRDNTSETDVTKLKDKDLIILLAGLKDVAQMRGIKSVKYDIVTASPEYVCMKCGITWSGNYETEGEDVYFEGTADAGLNNTEGFGQIYLAAIAENRAFCRAVRNFLKINIVAKEEIAPNKGKQASTTKVTTPSAMFSSQSSVSMSPDSFLLTILKENNITFEQVRNKLIEENNTDAKKWSSVKDIPRLTAFEIIDRIQKKAKAA